VLVVAGARNNTFSLEALEAIGKDIRRNSLGRGEQLTEATSIPREVANNQERPAVANQVERAGDRAGRAELCFDTGDNIR
jgi:hypothetical protein